MRTVEMLEQLLAVAERLGYQIRQEWLGGVGGGACEFKGRKWIFLDLALNAVEQLEQLTEALRRDPGICQLTLPPRIRGQLESRRAA